MEMDVLISILWCRGPRVSPKLRCYIQICNIPVPPPLQYLVFVNLCEALASLESAARTFLTSCGCRVPTHHKVLYESTCEIDEHCREVLKKTYNNPCNWPDITTFNPREKFQYCSTHKKMCKVRKYRRKNRISVQVVRFVVHDDDDDDDDDVDDDDDGDGCNDDDDDDDGGGGDDDDDDGDERDNDDNDDDDDERDNDDNDDDEENDDDGDERDKIMITMMMMMMMMTMMMMMMMRMRMRIMMMLTLMVMVMVMVLIYDELW